MTEHNHPEGTICGETRPAGLDEPQPPFTTWQAWHKWAIGLAQASSTGNHARRVIEDVMAEHFQLQDIIKEYAQHTSWRCQYQRRFPWNPDCHCGLTEDLRKVGLPAEWAAIYDPEKKT